MGGRDKGSEGLCRMAIVDDTGGQGHALGQIVGAFTDHQRGGGVEQDDVAVGPVFAGQQGRQGGRIDLGVASANVVDGASGRPASWGVTVKRRTVPSFHSATSVGPVVVSSSRPWP